LTSNLEVMWTPDGRLAWQQYVKPPDSRFNYRIRDLKTGEEDWLASETPGGWLSFPQFSPAGDRVALSWARMPPTPRGIWIESWPERRERLLTSADLTPIGWSHDGNSVLTITLTTPDISTISSMTGEPKVLMRLPVGIPVAGTTSVDGRTLVLTVVERTGDAWLVSLDSKTKH